MAKEKVEAIEHVREYLRTIERKPLRRISVGVYEMCTWNHHVLVTIDRNKKDLLTFELNNLVETGVSYRRLKMICKSISTAKTCITSNRCFITIKHKKYIHNQNDVSKALEEIDDAAMFTTEEIYLRTNGLCHTEDTDKEWAKEERHKAKMKRLQAELEEYEASLKAEGPSGIMRLDQQTILDFVTTTQIPTINNGENYFS